MFTLDRINIRIFVEISTLYLIYSSAFFFSKCTGLREKDTFLKSLRRQLKNNDKQQGTGFEQKGF